jgi:hypothetical protein
MSLPNCFPGASKAFVPNPWVAQNSYRTMPQPPRECRRPWESVRHLFPEVIWESGEGLRVAAASEAGDQLRRSDVFLSDPPYGIDGFHSNFGHGHMSWVDERLENVCECYAPEPPAIGIQRRDFVGWTGLAPTSLLMEHVFGLRANALSNTLFWNINLTDGHGVRRYPLRTDTQVDIYYPPRRSPTVRPRPSSTPHAR